MSREVRSERRRGRPKKGTEHDASALFETAVNCFAEQGFDKATLRAIAERAGVDVALISYRYGSKFGLWCAVVEHVGQTSLNELNAAFEADAHLAREERLDLLCKELVNLVIRRPAFAQILISETMTSIEGDRVAFIRNKVAEPIRYLLMKYITDIHQDRRVRDVDLELSLAAAISMVSVVVSSSHFLLDLIGSSNDMEMTSRQLAAIVKKILS